jgi:hypothetical protein
VNARLSGGCVSRPIDPRIDSCDADPWRVHAGEMVENDPHRITSAFSPSAPDALTPSRVLRDRATPATAQPSLTSSSMTARPKLRAPNTTALRCLPCISLIQSPHSVAVLVRTRDIWVMRTALRSAFRSQVRVTRLRSRRVRECATPHLRRARRGAPPRPARDCHVRRSGRRRGSLRGSRTRPPRERHGRTLL